MSTLTFQDTTAQAKVLGRERMNFHVLCSEAATRAGVRSGMFGDPALMLNACIKSRNDALVLVARIHGQSEMNVFVEGPNRAWLASIVEGGRTFGMLREGMGWEAVVTLLRAANDQPIVISSSQGGGFPNSDLAIEQQTWSPIDEDEPYEEWMEFPDDRKWELSVQALRSREQTTKFGWELKPDNWTTYRFATG